MDMDIRIWIEIAQHDRARRLQIHYGISDPLLKPYLEIGSKILIRDCLKVPCILDWISSQRIIPID